MLKEVIPQWTDRSVFRSSVVLRACQLLLPLASVVAAQERAVPPASAALALSDDAARQGVPPNEADVRTLLRLGRLEQLSQDLRARTDLSPGLSLVLGHVSQQLGDADLALAHYDRAMAGIPELRGLLEEQREAALAGSSRYRELLSSYTKSHNGDDLLALAERLLADGADRDAARVIQRAEKFARSQDTQVRLRLLKSKIALMQQRRYVALHYLRWVAVRAPLHERADEAVALLAKHFPTEPLKVEQRESRATAFANAGRVEKLEAELAALPAGASRMTTARDAHLRAWVRYRAREFEQAAPMLEAAARLAGTAGQSDLYHAGRAFSRSAQPKKAIALYAELAKSSPKTRYGIQAAFQMAREWSLLPGGNARAAALYEDFLKRFPSHSSTESARRELAITYYQLRYYGAAALLFRRLRLLSPSSQRAPMYQSLEALSLLGAGDADDARALLNQIIATQPLSFEAWTSRARLQSLAQNVAAPVPIDDPAGAPPTPPDLVRRLQALGLDEWADRALRKQESARYGTGMERYREICELYGQLDTGRRRYIIGISAAQQHNFQRDPGSAPRWVWNCLYPIPYPALVQQATAKHDVPAAFIYAVMRQESGFRPTVRSPADAFGLMQIIEPTAQDIATELGLRYRKSMLFEPPSNVNMGAYYLRKTLDYFTAQPALAAAAYNAGPNAVAHWQFAARGLPLEMFVARIPYDETRQYVGKVLANAWVYQSLYSTLGHLPQSMTVK